MRFLVFVVVGALGCSEANRSLDASEPSDVGIQDARPVDTGASPRDTGSKDASPQPDTGAPQDAGFQDVATSEDTGPMPADTGVMPGDAGNIACPFPPGSQAQKRALFTEQWPASDSVLEDAVIELLQAALPGSEVRIAMYSFTRDRMADAMVAAHDRGVDLRIVLDESNLIESPPLSDQYSYRSAVQTLIDSIGTTRVIRCNESNPPDGGGCQGPGINHNKFFLFSSLCDGTQNVVVQSSANLTNTQRRLHNNMVIIRDDPMLHAAYRSYWDALARQQLTPNYYQTADGSTGTRGYFFPRAPGAGAEEDTDTIHNILADNVDCTGGGRIRIMMAFWTMARGYLVDDLAQLQSEGCDVRVILAADSASPALRAHLERLFPSSQLVIALGVHSKYLLYEGQYLGSQRSLLWTGSHNYTGAALRENDETLLRIDDAAIFQAFEQNWDNAWISLGP